MLGDRKETWKIAVKGPDSDSAPQLPPADAFPGYEIVREVHRGGQGVVYQAIQRSTHRRVALKVMRSGALADLKERVRFEREIEVLGQLHHPNLVAIHDSGSATGNLYFAMDYVSGQPLDEYVVQHRCSVEEILRLFERICDAVNAAHLRGIVHRDLKPSNLRVDHEAVPHVLDFGLAKVAMGEVSHGAHPEMMTITGQFVGSIPWASPEQAEGILDRLDVRSDVYSLGVILFQMLTGRFPYDVSGSVVAALENIVAAEPRRPRSLRRGIDDELETIVLKCLHKERERRYQTAGELARDLRHYLAHEPIDAKRDSGWYMLRKSMRRFRVPILLGAGLVVVVVVALVVSLVSLRRASVESRRARDAQEAANSARALEARHRQIAELQAYSAGLAVARAALLDHDITTAIDALRRAPKALRNWEWHFLAGQLDQSVLTRFGHARGIACAACSADGRIVATAADTIRCFDARTGQELVALKPPRATVFGLAVSADGARVCAVTSDARVTCWNANSGTEVMSAEAATRKDSVPSRAAAFSLDGARLAIAGQPVRILDARSVAWCTDDSILVLGDADGAVFALDAAMEQVRRRFAPSGREACFAVDPSGRRVVIAAADRTARIWDLRTGNPRATLAGHGALVTAFAFAPDDDRIATGSKDGTVRVWDAETGANVAVFHGHTDPVSALFFVDGGQRLVSASLDGTLRWWPLKPDIPAPWTLPTGATRRATLDPNASRIADAEKPNKAHAVVVREPSSRDLRSLPVARPGLDEHVAAGPVFSGDGRSLAEASDRNTIKVWEAASGREIAVLDAKTAVARLCLDREARRLAVVSKDGSMRVVALPAGETLLLLDEPGARVEAAEFDAGGEHLASAASDGSLTIRSTATWRVVRSCRGLRGTAVGIGFARDGRRLAAVTIERARGLVLHLFDLAGEERPPVVREFEPTAGTIDPTATIVHLDWSPDGSRLLLAAGDAVAAGLLDSATGEPFSPVHEEFAYGALDARFLGDAGDRVALLGRTGAVTTLDAAAGQRFADWLRAVDAMRPFVDRRTDELFVATDALARLQTDPALTPLERAAATSLLLSKRYEPAQLNSEALEVVRQPGASDEEVRLAVRKARAAASEDPGKGTYWNTLGVGQYRMRDHDAALGSIERSLSMAETPAADLALRAMIQHARGDDALAHESLARLRAREPPWTDSASAVAFVGEFAADLKRAAAGQPADASLLDLLGHVLDVAGDGAGAEAAWRAALTADPGLSAARRRLASVLSRLERQAEAVAEFETARVDDEPSATGDPETLAGYCRSLRAVRRFADAEKELRRALDGDAVRTSDALWLLWLEIGFADLGLDPAELRSRLPGPAAATPAMGVREDVVWLLQELTARRPIRIHCGGNGVRGKDGTIWGRDRFQRGGFGFNQSETAPLKQRFGAPIAKTDDDALYQSERYSPGEAGHLTPGYLIPLPLGTYEVTLHFAEIARLGAAVRRFDVLLEGEKVLEDYEPVAVGFATADMQSFEIDVLDGAPDIDFMQKTENPKLSAIEIRER